MGKRKRELIVVYIDDRPYHNDVQQPDRRESDFGQLHGTLSLAMKMIPNGSGNGMISQLPDNARPALHACLKHLIDSFTSPIPSLSSVSKSSIVRLCLDSTILELTITMDIENKSNNYDGSLLPLSDDKRRNLQRSLNQKIDWHNDKLSINAQPSNVPRPAFQWPVVTPLFNENHNDSQSLTTISHSQSNVMNTNNDLRLLNKMRANDEAEELFQLFTEINNSGQSIIPFSQINNVLSLTDANYGSVGSDISLNMPFHTGNTSKNVQPNFITRMMPSNAFFGDNSALDSNKNASEVPYNAKTSDMINIQQILLSQAKYSEQFKFKIYPKYDYVHEIQKPTVFYPLSYIGVNYEFNLNGRLYDWPISLALLRSNSLQVQLRFSFVKEINVVEQRDCCFEHLCIDINGKKVYRYDETGERYKPFDITELRRFDFDIAKNQIRFFTDEPNFEWPFPCLFEVSIVEFKTVDNFLCKLQEQKCQHLRPEYTKNLINPPLTTKSQHSEVTLSKSKMKLICPLTSIRLVTPCRTIHCKHIECFDAFAFFKENHEKYDWKCPLCKKNATFEMLCIDGLFTEILYNTDVNCKEVVYKSDNTWEPIIVTEKQVEIIDLEEEDEHLSCF